MSAPMSLSVLQKRLICETQVEESNSEEDFLAKYLDPKDRTRQIPVKLISHRYYSDLWAQLKSHVTWCQVETSMKYMESVAFKKSYGDEPLWVKYRRNHKRQFAPQTRETCIR